LKELCEMTMEGFVTDEREHLDTHDPWAERLTIVDPWVRFLTGGGERGCMAGDCREGKFHDE
jgi:hypothetical protein